MGSPAGSKGLPGGAPVWETMEMSFPSGVIPEGIAHDIKARILKKFQNLAATMVFHANVPWELTIVSFAVLGVQRAFRAWQDNPWYWLVAWPQILGAAAAQWFPQAGDMARRRDVAHNASMDRFHAMVMKKALRETGDDHVPRAARQGLEAIGQRVFPAMPDYPFGAHPVRVNSGFLNTQDVPRLPGDGSGAPQDTPTVYEPTPVSLQEQPPHDIAFFCRVKHYVAPFLNESSNGFLVPLNADDRLEALYAGELNTEDEGWLFCRRCVPSEDVNSGWLLEEVVEREITGLLAERFKPGDTVYYAREDKSVGNLAEDFNPGSSIVQHVMHGEACTLLNFSGQLGKVQPSSGVAGWLYLEDLRCEPPDF